MKKAIPVLFFILIMGFASAQGIGVSPDRLSFELEKGDSAESSFTIFNPGSKEITFGIDSGLGWLNFYPGKGVIKPGKSTKIVAEASLPENADAGEYADLVSISVNSKPENKGISLQAGVGIKTSIRVKENENSGQKISVSKITSAAVVENKNKSRISRHQIIGSLITISIVVLGLLAYFGVENLILGKRSYVKSFK